MLARLADDMSAPLPVCRHAYGGGVSSQLYEYSSQPPPMCSLMYSLFKQSTAPPFTVQALGEPTSVLASLGTAVVFGSAVAAARIDARGREATHRSPAEAGLN